MSIQSTLDALTVHFELALPDVSVQDAPNTVPYSGTTPALILTEYEDYVERVYAGEGLKGNVPERPNLYSFVYLEAPVGLQGTDIATAFGRVRAAVEAIKVQFSKRSAQDLIVGGQAKVMAASEYLFFEYDRHGPFITYLNQLYIGCFGVLAVLEEYRTDVNDL